MKTCSASNCRTLLALRRRGRLSGLNAGEGRTRLATSCPERLASANLCEVVRIIREERQDGQETPVRPLLPAIIDDDVPPAEYEAAFYLPKESDPEVVPVVVELEVAVPRLMPASR